MRSLLCALAWLLLSAAAHAALPYDESADAQAQLQQALSNSGHSKRPVLVIFGANWCEDCRALDRALQSNKTAALMHRSFEVVKVDVGNFDRNLDLSKRYGDPIKKGIPAAVLLSPEEKLLYATHAGELADARRMSETGIHTFFKRVLADARH